MKKKLIIAGTVVFVLIVAGYTTFLRGSTRKYDFRFDKISTGDITMLVTATGTINAVTSIDVGTQVSGIVSRLYADFNSVVKEGQIIAQIDSTFLVQSVRDADAGVYRAKAQLADSKRAVDREKTLLDKGLDPQVNYDAALTTYESNNAALKQAEAALERAKINLAYATIYAPINGVVIDRKVNVGQTVAASFSSPTLYTIANDLSKMQVLTTVDESDIGKISIGQEATFSVDAYPDENFKGRISQIRLAPVSVQNVVNYTVVIDVKNDQLKLMPGMTANVKVLVATSHNVLRIPNMALRFQPPAGVIDTARANAMREAFGANGGGMRWNGSTGTGPDSSGKGFATQQNNGMQGNRSYFKAMRDSINNAHGGNLSQEELRAEMQNALASMRNGSHEAPPTPVKQSAPQKKEPTFGITQRFPEYEKSAYVPLHQAGRGRVWVVNASGMLEPLYVVIGITDGKFTEVTGADLKPGEQIVLGATNTGDVATVQTQNPLTGGGQQRGTGGGGGFR